MEHFVPVFDVRMNLSLSCFAPFEAIDNEANERCKPLCYTAIRRVLRSADSHGPKTPTPPYVGTSVNIRPLPIFFEFFYEFSRLSHVVIFYVYFLIYHIK